MKRVHYFSGLFITAFIGLHLFNHLMALSGPERHISIMESLRLVYRNPVVELTLLLAVVVQVISGLRLMVKRWQKSTSFFERLQLWSGLYMAFFLLFHVAAVCVGRMVLDLDTNIYFGAAGLNAFPACLFFIPYYSLAILAFFGHVAAIHTLKMKNCIGDLRARRQGKVILLMGFIVTVLCFYGLTNGFVGMDIPSEYGVLTGEG